MRIQEFASTMAAKRSRVSAILAGTYRSVVHAFDRDFLQKLLAGFIAISGLLFLDGQLGPFTLQLRRVVGVASILVIAGVMHSRCVEFTRTDMVKLLGCCLLALGILALPTTPGTVLLYVSSLAALVSCCKSETIPRGVVEASFCYVVFGMIKDFVPELRIVEQSLLPLISRYVFQATGVRFIGSAGSISLPSLAAIALFLVWRWCQFRRTRTLCYLALLTGAWFLVLPLWIPASSAGPLELFTRSTIVSMIIVALGLLPACLSGTAVPLVSQTDKRIRNVSWFVAAIVAIFVGAVSAGGVIPLESPNPKILVHNRGGLDWERPVFGKFGMFSGGMFGLLPVYAKGNGFEFDVLDKDGIERDDLRNTQILVLINSPRQWSSEEKAAITEFVSEGGSLLILGDHTDVFGLMKGFNTLLADFGIRFRFDSAYFSRSGWGGCCATAPDTVASKWDLEGHGVAIGASLELSGSARPLLVGRYSHSDIGMENNVMGSFLGNYSLDEGEQIGDQTLVAMVNHGRGRIMVWGDTSPFQGAGTTSFSQSVGPVLNLLSRKTQFLERTFSRRAAALLLVGILVVALLMSESSWLLASLTAAMCIAYHGTTLINNSVLDSPIRIAKDCFLIDESQFPATGHYEAGINSIGPLHTGLLRSGLRVAELEEWDFQSFRKARGIAFVAPQKTFTAKQVLELAEFEHGGGIVLVSAGYPDTAGCLPLLEGHGLSLAPRPLGTIPAGSAQQNIKLPRFLDAYPIVTMKGEPLGETADIDILYKVGDDVTAVFCRNGAGGLLLFADTRFFSSRNVEHMSSYREGNLALIHDVFRKYLAVDPGSVKPLFPSPVMPK